MPAIKDGFTQHYLLFLQLQDTLPEYYLSLAQYLGARQVQLVPILPAQLNQLPPWDIQNLLILTPDLASFQSVEKMRRKFLDFSFMNGRYRLFHLTGFRNFTIPGNQRKIGNYYPFRLPCYLEETAEMLAKIILAGEGPRQWPGGTRAKIPQL